MFLLKISAEWLLNGSLFIAKLFTPGAVVLVGTLTSLIKISLEHSVQYPCLKDLDELG